MDDKLELLSNAELNPKVPLFLQFRAVVRTPLQLFYLTDESDAMVTHERSRQSPSRPIGASLTGSVLRPSSKCKLCGARCCWCFAHDSNRFCLPWRVVDCAFPLERRLNSS